MSAPQIILHHFDQSPFSEKYDSFSA